MGDSYAIALSKGLEHLSPEAVNVADNRMSHSGSLAIITKMREKVKFLDMSYNMLGKNVGAPLGDFIKQKATE